ncbi:MAG: UDP-3-O-(3-hydroxymyristoyl)glucosamine N-acyltransferase [Lentisphaerae bacterium]|nr:UDP-3-O-(3-hydroxymyristoyl)glucosamine N-acyltransferase [Lentisphaerota bacterium]
MTLAEIAQLVGGTLEGDGRLPIDGLSGVREAGPRDLSFLAGPRYAAAAARTRAAALVVDRSWRGACACALIRVDDPEKAFMRAAAKLAPPPPAPPPGVHPSAVVAPDARLGTGVSVGPLCVIESGARVGDRSAIGAGCYIGRDAALGRDGLLYPHVTVRERVTIGDRAIIHSGAVIGSDGFGYVLEEGAWKKIPQIGVVTVGDDVEIGANVTVDRARFGRTVIGNGVKIDNLVQIAHNVVVGDHTAMAAQVGIAGSTLIGKRAQFGGQSGAAGHIEIGDGVVVAGRGGVTKSIPGPGIVSGFPAMPHDRARRLQAHIGRLPELKKAVEEIARRLAELERRSGA